jgi:hypothetical protein
VGIGKQCAGKRCNYREERVLASNVLMQEVTIEGSGYCQVMHWHRMQRGAQLIGL